MSMIFQDGSRTRPLPGGMNTNKTMQRKQALQPGFQPITSPGQAQPVQPQSQGTPYGQGNYAAYSPQQAPQQPMQQPMQGGGNTYQTGIGQQAWNQSMSAWNMPKQDLLQYGSQFQPQPMVQPLPAMNQFGMMPFQDINAINQQRAAVVQQINQAQANQQVGTYLGQGAPPEDWGRMQINPQQMWGNAQQMVQQGWQNPFGMQFQPQDPLLGRLGAQGPRPQYGMDPFYIPNPNQGGVMGYPDPPPDFLVADPTGLTGGGRRPPRRSDQYGTGGGYPQPQQPGLFDQYGPGGPRIADETGFTFPGPRQPSNPFPPASPPPPSPPRAPLPSTGAPALDPAAALRKSIVELGNPSTEDLLAFASPDEIKYGVWSSSGRGGTVPVMSGAGQAILRKRSGIPPTDAEMELQRQRAAGAAAARDYYDTRNSSYRDRIAPVQRFDDKGTPIDGKAWLIGQAERADEQGRRLVQGLDGYQVFQDQNGKWQASSGRSGSPSPQMFGGMPPGAAQPIQPPSQGSPYGSGIRAWDDPTNPVGPSRSAPSYGNRDDDYIVDQSETYEKYMAQRGQRSGYGTWQQPAMSREDYQQARGQYLDSIPISAQDREGYKRRAGIAGTGGPAPAPANNVQARVDEFRRQTDLMSLPHKELISTMQRRGASQDDINAALNAKNVMISEATMHSAGQAAQERARQAESARLRSGEMVRDATGTPVWRNQLPPPRSPAPPPQPAAYTGKLSEQEQYIRNYLTGGVSRDAAMNSWQFKNMDDRQRQGVVDGRMADINKMSGKELKKYYKKATGLELPDKKTMRGWGV